MAPADPSPSALSRRGFLALGVGALVVSTLPRVRAGGRRRFARTVPAMGTVVEVSVVDADPRRARAAIDAGIAELLRVERLLTRFSDDSDVGRANRGAATRAVPVSEETAHVVGEALRWAEASDGSFDPTLERAIDLWDVLRRRVPPEAALVRRYAGRRLWRAVDVGAFSGGHAVRFSDPDVGLDLGGIAKGHAVDRAAAAIRALGVRDALVVAGGDLVALGRSEAHEAWCVGVRSPSDPAGIVDVLDVSDAAVATSGDYERFFEWGGRRYHHILDSETAEPRRSPFHGVTVRGPSCLAADAGATAAFGRPAPWTERLLARRAPGAAVVATA